MALPCHSVARTCSESNIFAINRLRNNRYIAHTDSTKNAAIAFDFLGWTQRFSEVVGKFHRGSAFNAGNLADQADGIETAIAGGIALAEIIGE